MDANRWQPGRRLAAAGDDDIRRDFGQRFEHKGAQMHAWVRNQQARGVDDLLIIKQQVEVEGARGVVVFALTAKAVFDVEQGGQQGVGRHV